jgi:hypothetical protein
MTHKIDCLECFVVGERQGEETGSLVEMERIIKLLEDEQLDCTISQNEEQHKFAHLVFEGVREQFITLIKGEK